MSNYNSSLPGVPFVRSHRIVINYPVTQLPTAEIYQHEAVKLVDNSVRVLNDLDAINATFNLADTTPIPLVDPTTGGPLGPTVTVGQVMLSILAVVRKLQLEAEAQPEEPQPEE